MNMWKSVELDPPPIGDEEYIMTTRRLKRNQRMYLIEKNQKNNIFIEKVKLDLAKKLPSISHNRVPAAEMENYNNFT